MPNEDYDQQYGWKNPVIRSWARGDEEMFPGSLHHRAPESNRPSNHLTADQMAAFQAMGGRIEDLLKRLALINKYAPSAQQEP